MARTIRGWPHVWPYAASAQPACVAADLGGRGRFRTCDLPLVRPTASTVYALYQHIGNTDSPNPSRIPPSPPRSCHNPCHDVLAGGPHVVALLGGEGLVQQLPGDRLLRPDQGVRYSAVGSSRLNNSTSVRVTANTPHAA
jgi:hypothetical protein